jgi:hypothetical protein
MDGHVQFELDWLFKVRTVVARVGEWDVSRWWRTDGQLGPQGAAVMRRGLPRTHYFAQARTVFAVAADRSAQIFDPPGCVNLWRLTETVEDRIDAVWESWLDDAESWRPFFERVASIRSLDLVKALQDFELVTEYDIRARNEMKKSLDERSIQVPGTFEGDRQKTALLALYHSAGSEGNLVVPYARRADV